MDNFTGGTTSWLPCDDRSRYLDDLWFTGVHSSDRYSGALDFGSVLQQYSSTIGLLCDNYASWFCWRTHRAKWARHCRQHAARSRILLLYFYCYNTDFNKYRLSWRVIVKIYFVYKACIWFSFSQSVDFSNHGLCGSNKLLYKRCV